MLDHAASSAHDQEALPVAWRSLGRLAPPAVALILGLVLLTDTAFWAGMFLVISGGLFSRLRLRRIPAVLAAFYMGHYQFVQDAVGDPGPFVMRNWMAAGFVAGMILIGYGLTDAVQCRTMSGSRLTYVGAVVALVALSALTVSDRSFLADDAPAEYVRLWFVTALATAALALMSEFRVRTFLLSCLVLGYLNLFFLPLYVGTGLGTAWSCTVSAAALSTLIVLRRRPWIGVALAAPLGVGLVLAGKEGPIAATIVGLLAWYVMNGRGPRQQRGRLIAVIATGTAGALLLWATGLWGALGRRVMAAGLDVRMSLYQEVWSRFRQSPVFGEWMLSPAIPGPMEFFPNATHELLAYPHSSILEVLLSWGLIGLAIWLAAQVVAARAAWRAALLPLWLAGLISAQSSGDLTSNYTYWFVGAIAVAVGAVGTEAFSQTSGRDEPVEVQPDTVAQAGA